MEKAEIRKLIENGVLQSAPDLQLWEQELQELVDNGFLQHLSQQEIYTFSNNLTWEVVYETLLFAERRRLHDLVAQHIEVNNQEKLDSVASILLHHYEKADNYKKVVYFGAKAGDRAGSLFANEDAISFYKSAIIALDKLDGKTRLDKCLLLEHIGDIYDVAGEYKEANTAYQQALEIWLNKGDEKKLVYMPWKFRASIQEAILCRKLAVVNERASDYDKAIMWLNSAEQSLPSRPGYVKAQILSTRSGILHRKGEFPEAIKVGKNAVSLARKLEAAKDLAYAINVLTNSLIATGQMDKAIAEMQSAINTYQKIEDYPGLAISYYTLGDCYSNLGDFNKAEENFRKALEIDIKMRNSSAIAMDNYVLAEILSIKGADNEAVEHYEKIVELYESGKGMPDLTGTVQTKLGHLYFKQGEAKKAENTINAGLKLLKEIGIPIQVLTGEYRLASLKFKLEEFNNAKEISYQILSDINDNDNLNIVAMQVRYLLGEILHKTGELEQAINEFNESALLAETINQGMFKAQAEFEKLKIRYETGKYDESDLESLELVIGIFKQVNMDSLVAQAEELYKNMQKH